MNELQSAIDAALARQRDHPYVVAPSPERPRESVYRCEHVKTGHTDSLALGKQCLNCQCNGFRPAHGAQVQASR